MRELWIFGDSYVDPKYGNQLVEPSDNTWVNKLKEDYRVSNFAIQGTGPQWSIYKLIDQISQYPNTEDVSMIFVHSDIYRLPMDFWKNDFEQSHTLDVANGNLKHPKHNFLHDFIQHYTNLDWQLSQELFIYSTLNQLAKRFRQVLFMPTCEGNSCVTSDILTYEPNFYTINECLNNLSIRDCGLKHEQLVVDKRHNHFHEHNHTIWFDMIVDWMENCTPIDTSKIQFVKNR